MFLREFWPWIYCSILGSYWDLGRTEKKKETTIWGLGFRGYIGRIENKDGNYYYHRILG